MGGECYGFSSSISFEITACIVITVIRSFRISALPIFGASEFRLCRISELPNFGPQTSIKSVYYWSSPG